MTFAGYLVTAAAVALLTVSVGLRRSRLGAGRWNVFHPMVFPVAYIAIASLIPTWYVYVEGNELNEFTEITAGPELPKMVALSVVGFCCGTWIRFKPRRSVETNRAPIDRRFLRIAGRALIVAAIFGALADLAGGSLDTRGQGQDVYTTADSLLAAAGLAASAGVVLMAWGAYELPRVVTRFDLILLMVLVALLAASGRRAVGLTVVLVLVGVISWKRGAALRVMASMCVLAVASFQILEYRMRSHGSSAPTAVEGMLGDLSSIAFTTGATHVSMGEQTMGGATLFAALIRQLPSPVAVPLLGPPTDTGAFVFRSLFPVDSAMGYGYSIPAEGVLNFGLLGAFLVPLACGGALAWLYAKVDLASSHSSGWVYLLAAAWVPFAWRSDALGAVKGVLYPAIMMGMAAVLARSLASTSLRPHARNGRRGRQRVRRSTYLTQRQ